MNLSIQTFWHEKANAFLCVVIAIVLVVSASISISANASSPQVEGVAMVGNQMPQNQALLDQTLAKADCAEIITREDCCDENEQPCPDNSDCTTICTNANVQLPIIHYQNDALRHAGSSLKTVSDTALRDGISLHLNAPPPRD